MACTDYCGLILTYREDATVAPKPPVERSISNGTDSFVGLVGVVSPVSALGFVTASNTEATPKPSVYPPVCFAPHVFASPVCALSSDCETDVVTPGDVKASLDLSQFWKVEHFGKRGTHDSDIIFLKGAVAELPLLAMLGVAIVLILAAACDTRKHVSRPVR